MNTIQLTDVDHLILQELARDGRLPYKILAERVGVPTSTCHARVKALEERGVIRGYRADIDPTAAGKHMNALILISIHGERRDAVPLVTEELRRIPGVQQVFLIGGEKDLIVHVSTSSIQDLRNLISQYLGPNENLTQTQTQIIFEHFPGLSPI